MKATILVRDLVKLIAKHGDPSTTICILLKDGREVSVELKCVDEAHDNNNEFAFELYGEEK
ncbi:MAG: hypothetical protein WA981_00895 [Glaciecola sp.]